MSEAIWVITTGMQQCYGDLVVEIRTMHNHPKVKKCPGQNRNWVRVRSPAPYLRAKEVFYTVLTRFTMGNSSLWYKA
jgi:hypothetical protein